LSFSPNSVLSRYVWLSSTTIIVAMLTLLAHGVFATALGYALSDEFFATVVTSNVKVTCFDRTSAFNWDDKVEC